MIGIPIYKEKINGHLYYEVYKTRRVEAAYWRYLSKNPNAIHILERNIDKICWFGLSKNQYAIHILNKNLDKVCWSVLAENPNGICMLEKYLDIKSIWPYEIFTNTNPKAIHLIEKIGGKNLHLFSFKTPILIGKNKKNCKINSRNFTYDGLTFSSSLFLLEDVKDEMWKHNGRSCFCIHN